MYLNFINHKIWNCIKVLLYSSSFFVFSSALPAAQYKPLPVDGDGKLAPNSKFVSANGIVTASNLGKFRQDFRLFIDTQPSPDNNSTIGKMQWWSDCEIKCIDKWGNLVYFTSTIALNNSQVAALHPQITDKTPKIYYWRGDLKNPAGGCWGLRGQLTNFNLSIGANGSYGYSAIWIYPSLSSTETRTVPIYTGLGKSTNKQVVWGEYVRSVLNNPDNTVLCWRQTKTEGEIFNSRKLWRPVRIEFYGDLKEIK